MADLTLSGNEITDAVRNTATEGDGRDAELSMGVWEATTNLCTNGGFESDTTGWSTGGTNTIAASTDQAKFGSNSLKCTYQDSANLAIFALTLTAAEHTVSAWVYIPTSYSGSQVQMRDSGTFASATGTQFVNADMSTRDEWQRVSTDITPDAGDLSGNYYFVNDGATSPAAGDVVYVDGFQVETQPIATPYVETDGATAARTASEVTIPVSLIDETQSWVAMRLRMNWDSTVEIGGGTDPRNFAWFDDADNKITCLYDIGNTRWQLLREATTATDIERVTDTFSDGDVKTVIAAWTSTAVSLSVDGAAFESTAGSDIPTLAAATAEILGTPEASSGAMDADVFWIATGTGTLTDADAARFAAAPNNTLSYPGSFDYFNQGAAACTMLWTPQGASVAEYTTSGLATLQPLTNVT